MKITNEQLLNAGAAIPFILDIRDNEGKIPAAKVGVQIGRLVGKLQHELQVVNPIKVTLWRKYGKENGPNIDPPDVNDPNYDAFVKERDEFFAGEVTRTFDLVVVPQDYRVHPMVWASCPEEMMDLAQEPPTEKPVAEKKPS